MSKVSFWRQSAVQHYLDEIDKRGFIYKRRWNDILWHSTAVQLFMPRAKVHLFDDFTYEHASRAGGTGGEACVVYGGISQGTKDPRGCGAVRELFARDFCGGRKLGTSWTGETEKSPVPCVQLVRQNDGSTLASVLAGSVTVAAPDCASPTWQPYYCSIKRRTLKGGAPFRVAHGCQAQHKNESIEAHQERMLETLRVCVRNGTRSSKASSAELTPQTHTRRASIEAQLPDECAALSSTLSECGLHDSKFECWPRQGLTEDTHASDELSASYLRQPSHALSIALLVARGNGQIHLIPRQLWRPAKSNSYLLPGTYLPSPKYWCELSQGHAALLRKQQEVRQAAHERRCSAASALNSTEAIGLLTHPNRGGVSKNLVYLAESAARGADDGWVQFVPQDAPWDFARGVRRCADGEGRFSCFFRATLCKPRVPRTAPRCDNCGRFPRYQWRRFEPWPQSAMRGMNLALALEARILTGLQPWVEERVHTILQSAASLTEVLPQQSSSIGMHVRRGDACVTYNISVSSQRRCFGLEAYVVAARHLRRLYGEKYSTILLVTDSEEVLHEASAFRDFAWCVVRYDRAAVGGKQGINVGTKTRGQRLFVEDRAASGDPANEQLVISMLAELRFISAADLFVGTSRSFVSLGAALRNHLRRVSLSSPTYIRLSCVGSCAVAHLGASRRAAAHHLSRGRPNSNNVAYSRPILAWRRRRLGLDAVHLLDADAKCGVRDQCRWCQS